MRVPPVPALSGALALAVAVGAALSLQVRADAQEPRPVQAQRAGQQQVEQAPPGTTTRVVLTQEDTPAGRVEREYLLTVPRSGRGPRPVVVALHGRAQSTASLREATGLEALGEREGFVSVFPVGWAGVWNAGTCCDSRAAPPMPDVAFLDQVLADVAARTPVDRTRVHLVGYSNGGMLAYRYACERTAVVAGVGVVAGSMAASPDYADQGEQRCRPDAPVSVVAVHGQDDRTVPYPGGPVAGTRGGSVAPVRSGVDQAAVASECRTGRTSRVGASVRIDYTSCADGTAVRLVVLRGHGHGWTRDSRRYGYDTTAGVWSFLAPRRLPAAP